MLIEKVHLTNIFDMFAGVSAGSFIVTGMAVPELDNANEPRYWADDIVRIFSENAELMFMKNQQPGTVVYIIWLSVTISAFGVFFNVWCRSRY